MPTRSDNPTPLSDSESDPPPPGFIIEVRTSGRTPAQACALVVEVRRGEFQLTPLSLVLASGEAIEWLSPALGLPIATIVPFNQVRDFLAFWAGAMVTRRRRF